jgi:hypothetical protein
MTDKLWIIQLYGRHPTIQLRLDAKLSKSRPVLKSSVFLEATLPICLFAYMRLNFPELRKLSKPLTTQKTSS